MTILEAFGYVCSSLLWSILFMAIWPGPIIFTVLLLTFAVGEKDDNRGYLLFCLGIIAIICTATYYVYMFNNNIWPIRQ